MGASAPTAPGKSAPMSVKVGDKNKTKLQPFEFYLDNVLTCSEFTRHQRTLHILCKDNNILREKYTSFGKGKSCLTNLLVFLDGVITDTLLALGILTVGLCNKMR